MPISYAWSTQADRHLLSLRAAGRPWREIATELRVGRNTAIDRARRLGVRPMTHLPPPSPPRPQPERSDRPPLAAGHPITWRAITDGTSLDGARYPYPVFL